MLKYNSFNTKVLRRIVIVCSIIFAVILILVLIAMKITYDKITAILDCLKFAS